MANFCDVYLMLYERLFVCFVIWINRKNVSPVNCEMCRQDTLKEKFGGVWINLRGRKVDFHATTTFVRSSVGTLALTLKLAIQKSIFESRKFCHETLHYKLIFTGITFS